MDAAVTPLTPQNAAAELAERDLAGAGQAARRHPAVERVLELPARQRWMLAVGLALVLALLVGLPLANRKATMAPLFTGSVSDKDAGAAVALLKQQEIPYEVVDGTGSIMVPADKAGELRMKMAAQGLPKGTVAGFELLDNPRFGQSPTQERTSLQRALEGELTRSILTLSGVQNARVHLALPRFEGYYREQSKPSASVVVGLHPGRTLDRGQVAGIVHLVASSVPDLNPRAVSVLDQDGTLLSANQDGNDRQELSQQQRRQQQELEQRLLERVNGILDPVLGRENLRATVTADLDFNQIEQTSESHRPNQTPGTAALRSERTLDDGTGRHEIEATGIPGAASNQPPTPASAPITGPAQALHPAGGASGAGALGNGGRRERQINYEVDRTVEVKRQAVGTVRRLNVAVLVNHRESADAKGKKSVQAVPPEEIEKLTALVQEAVGFQKDRGDSVKVVSIPFRPVAPTPEPPVWRQPWAQDVAKNAFVPLAAAILGLVLIFAVIRPAMRKPVDPAEEQARLDARVDDPQALPAPEEQIDPMDPDSPEKVAILADARELARANAPAVAAVLKQWMAGEKKA